jgi:hypothetical protein
LTDFSFSVIVEKINGSKSLNSSSSSSSYYFYFNEGNFALNKNKMT